MCMYVYLVVMLLLVYVCLVIVNKKREAAVFHQSVILTYVQFTNYERYLHANLSSLTLILNVTSTVHTSNWC